MGSHVWHCNGCGNSHVTYNGCNNRHCASCGGRKRLEWVDRILGWAVSTNYVHCVVTLPHEFIPLMLANDNVLYRLFFQCVSQALRDLAMEQHGARVGVVMVLHTWGQRMNAHPHIHTIVTVGGLSENETSWVTVDAESLYTREEVATRFRGLFLAGLRRLFRQQKLTMPQDMAVVQDEAALDKWLECVLCKPWQANVQTAPAHCHGPEAVVKYLAAYVVGSAIRDSRILRHDGRSVVIRVKNYRTGNFEEQCMTGEEFVEQFALHILPARMLRVRYAGLFSAGRRKERLDKCRELCAALQVTEQSDDSALSAPAEDCEQDIPAESELSPTRYGPDCRRCGMPAMESQGRLSPLLTTKFLNALVEFSCQVYLRLSTFDVDVSTRTMMSESLDCVPAAIECSVMVWADNNSLEMTSHWIPDI